MSDTEFRPAVKSDCQAIAELYRISSDGVSDYIWSKLANPGEDLLEVGRRRYEREDSLFSYRNCMVAELDGRLVGMLVAFPMHCDPEQVEDDPVLAPYGRLESDASYYICGVALFPGFRGRGLGSSFMYLAEQKAMALGFAKTSLIVFEQNVGAVRLYRKLGYYETMREKVIPHPLIHCNGDAVLMVKDLG